jgi:N-acetylmuramoyl-L-alanine amidase
MIILTAGHTGPNTGAQCAETHFDEGAENIWLRNRIAEILTNKYGLVVLMDDDKTSLKLLVKELSRDTDNRPLSPAGSPPNSGGQQDRRTVLKNCTPELGGRERSQLRSSEGVCSLLTPHSSFLIDIHFNAHTNPNARGTEAIVADDATMLELRFASHLVHTTSDALGIPLRCIKSESQTPHHRLAMLHLTPQSIILEVCFCTSPEDVEAYRKNREKLAADLAWAIYELL